MAARLWQRCTAVVEELNLAERRDILDVSALTGGVASDIAVVKLPGRNICVKLALSQLKVQTDWRAPVHRNGSEYAWLEFAGSVSPGNAVQLLGRSRKHHGFAMEYVCGDDVYLWKNSLLDETPSRGEASRVGDLLGRMHAASTALDFDASQFRNRDDFEALRIEPYLHYTLKCHPGLSGPIMKLASMLYESDQVLVHGDVSPKNILLRSGQPILLDAECATMGDASFDPSFCINHLVLKAVHLPESRSRLLNMAGEFWRSYSSRVTWEPRAELERRICQVLPALMLARVDGKSPVEYLDRTERNCVRGIAKPLLLDPAEDLASFLDFAAHHMGGQSL